MMRAQLSPTCGQAFLQNDWSPWLKRLQSYIVMETVHLTSVLSRLSLVPATTKPRSRPKPVCVLHTAEVTCHSCY